MTVFDSNSPVPALALACVLAIGLGSTGCGSSEVAWSASDEAQGAWSSEIQPILSARCGTCHSGADPAAGLSVESWSAFLKGSDYGEAVIAYAPDQSLAVRLLEQLPESLPAGYAWQHGTPFDDFRHDHSLPATELDRLREWIAQGAKDDGGNVPFSGERERVFVALQDAGLLAVIDVDAKVVARIIDFEEYGGRAAIPHDTAIEPDGSYLYVTLIGAQGLLKIDVASGEVAGALDVRSINPTFRPGMLAIDPHSNRLYLSRSISDLTGGRSIIFVDRENMMGEEVLVPFTRPHPIGLARDGRYVLSGSLADNLVAAIDAQTFDLTPPLRVDGTATPLLHYDVAPDGTTAAITGQLSHTLYLIDITDPHSLSVAHSVPVGEEPWYPAYTPDGRFVVVPNHRSNTVSLVGVAEGEVVREIGHDRFAMPHAAAVTVDGRYIFVSNSNLTHDDDHAHEAESPDERRYQPRYPFDRSGDGVVDNLQTGHVAVIEFSSSEVVRIIELEEFPSGMAIWPNVTSR